MDKRFKIMVGRNSVIVWDSVEERVVESFTSKDRLEYWKRVGELMLAE